MDSLLATYASSDEEDDDQQQHQNPKQNQSKSFSSLPPPKQTLTNPPPSNPRKSSHPESRSDSKSLFSRLPQPKSERSDPFSLNPKPKKVVQFRPPIIPKIEDDEEEEEEDVKEKQRIKDEFIPQAPSVKSFLSSIPAPRNSGSLGALPSSSGTGRRSILEAQVPGLSNSNAVADKSLDNPVKSESSSVNLSESSYVNYDSTTYANVGSNESADVAAPSAGYGSYDYGGYENVDMNNSSYGPAAPPESGDHGGYGGYEGYSEYGSHVQYESKWIDRSSGDLGPEISEPVVQNVGRASGKRGRNEIPQDVIEVSQDELMKNRPREDQVKMTGIAFGPAYQPASSAKGKPTKLHKRKHQIGSLYFDMRSKEMELAERRSKGFLTKAETQAKYGW